MEQIVKMLRVGNISINPNAISYIFEKKDSIYVWMAIDNDSHPIDFTKELWESRRMVDLVESDPYEELSHQLLEAKELLLKFANGDCGPWLRLNAKDLIERINGEVPFNHKGETA